MSITLNPRVEELIRQKMVEGRYSTADDVIEDALLALFERDRARQLHSLLQVGIDQADRGEVIPNTPAFWDDLDREVDERLLRGDAPRPEVRS